MVSTLPEARKFIKKVGYPVVVKPDNGVGASNNLQNKKLMRNWKNFYRNVPAVPYIMEEYVFRRSCFL